MVFKLQSSLKNKYLTDFEPSKYFEEIRECEPYREEGVSGFFNRMIDRISNDPELLEKNDVEAKEKDKRKIGKFFDNIFKRKNYVRLTFLLVLERRVL